MKKFAVLLLTSCLLFILSFSVTSAHPGRTASDGCHYCRTNCDSWGVAWNQRHCHNGYSAPSSSSTNSSGSVTKSAISTKPTPPSCPSNSYYNSTLAKCSCDIGYTASLSRKTCVKVPENAHVANNGTDVWLCDNGYKESGNFCAEVKAFDEIDIEELHVIPAEPVDAVSKVDVQDDVVDDPKSISKPEESDEEGYGVVILFFLIIGGYLYNVMKKK